jgi:hypothetical protein
MDAERALALAGIETMIKQQGDQYAAIAQFAGKTRREREIETQLVEYKLQLQAQGIILSQKELDDLREQLKSWEVFHELGVQSAAINRFVDSFEVGFDQIERSGEQAYSHLEDALVAFVQTGKLQIGTLVDYIQQELIRLSIRSLISSVLQSAGGAQGITSWFGSLFSPAATPQIAPATGASAFAAEGGIFTRPTQTWIAEAGDPELALPLNQQGADFVRRAIGSGESQGVTVVVNNYSDADVTASQGQSSDGTKTIELMIRDTTKKLMGSGAFDRDLKTNFGIARKGVTS